MSVSSSPSPCGCGCGLSVSVGKRFRHGHWLRTANAFRVNHYWSGKTKFNDNRLLVRGGRHSVILRNRYKNGLVVWNRNKTKSTDVRVAQASVRAAMGVRRLFKTGYTVWNKNRTKEMDVRVKRHGESTSRGLKRLYAAGAIVWNTGKTKATDDRIRKSCERSRAGLLKRFANGYQVWNKGQTKYTDSRLEAVSRKIASYWDDPEMVKKFMVGLEKRPTTPERWMMVWLEVWLSSYFRYVGNRAFWIGRKNPDFICSEFRLVIEVFGKHWHRDRELPNRQTEEERCKYFVDRGWSAIVIWDYEIPDPDAGKINSEVARTLWYRLSDFVMKSHAGGSNGISATAVEEEHF